MGFGGVSARVVHARAGMRSLRRPRAYLSCEVAGRLPPKFVRPVGARSRRLHDATGANGNSQHELSQDPR